MGGGADDVVVVVVVLVGALWKSSKSSSFQKGLVYLTHVEHPHFSQLIPSPSAKSPQSSSFAFLVEDVVVAGSSKSNKFISLAVLGLEDVD